MLPHYVLIYRDPEDALAEVVVHLDAGGDPRAHDNTALVLACLYGRLDILDRLLTGYPGVSGYPGLTADDARAGDNRALRWASLNGHLAVVERLLSLGLTLADARAHNNFALRLACVRGHINILERLIELGLGVADARVGNNFALVWACKNGHHAVVARLLELGVEPTPYALVLCGAGRQDENDDEWTQRLWRAVVRWEGSQELAVAESGLTPAQHEAWVDAKDLARPSRLRFSD